MKEKRHLNTKTFFITAIFSCFLISIYAQPKTNDSILTKIKDVGFRQSQVKMLTYDLSDIFGQRLTGSREYLAAAKWASIKMKEAGLTNVHFENYCTNCRGWNVKSFNVEMQSPNYMHITAYPLAWTKGTNGSVEGDVINIKSFSDMDSIKNLYKGMLRNKIILLGKEPTFNPLPNPISRRFSTKELEDMQQLSIADNKTTPLPKAIESFQKEYSKDSTFLKFAESEGVLAVFKASASSAGLMKVGGTYYYKENNFKPLPYFIILPEHAGRLVRLINQNIVPKIRLNLETIFYNESDNNVNIIGEIKGSDPKLNSEVVMVGAHFDSWHSGTGATDNGGNCMVLLEALRILKKSGIAPRRTIRLAFWGGEEQDFNGSVAYATKHYGKFDRKPNRESEKVSVYLNLDDGIGAIRGIYLQENILARPVFEEIFDGFSVEEQYYTTIENNTDTDHETFNYYNIPSFAFIQDPLDYNILSHHKMLDLPEYASESDMKKNAVFLAWTIYSLASSDEMVPRKPEK